MKDLPNDGVPTFGFREITFSPKRSCVVCSRRVYVGLVSISNEDPTSEDFRVVCRTCARRWDEEAKEMP